MTVLLLHRLQQRRLRLRRGAVDLVGQHEVGEDRPGLELGSCAARRLLDEDVGADDVGGHQVGRELDAVELQSSDVGEGPHQHRLAEAGHAFQQRVAAGDRQISDCRDELVLADDDAARPRASIAARAIGELLDGELGGAVALVERWLRSSLPALPGYVVSSELEVVAT